MVEFRKQLLSPLLFVNPLCVVVVANANVANELSKSSFVNVPPALLLLLPLPPTVLALLPAKEAAAVA
jgi:hypothetical protein